MKLKYALFALSIFVAVGVSELLLRSIGYEPGMLLTPFDDQTNSFRRVDSLFEYDTWMPDSLGLMHPNQNYIKNGLPADLQKRDAEMFDFFKNNVLDRYVNEQGYRTHHFDSIDKSQKKKVLLIGDSHTWCVSNTRHLKTIFPEYMEQQDSDLLTINLGGPGTDVLPIVLVSCVQLFAPDPGDPHHPGIMYRPRRLHDFFRLRQSIDM